MIVCRRLEERDGQRLGLGLPLQLGGWAPVGASLVERIEHNVSAVRRVKLTDELAGRVVNNRAVLPLGNLAEDLPDDRRFSRPVSPTMRKCVFSASRGMRSRAFCLFHLEAYSVPGELLGEFLRIDQNRPF